MLYFLKILRKSSAGVVVALLLSACSDDDDHGPYWEDSHVVPTFAMHQNELSTSFTGFVDPKKSFLFGAAEGFLLDKPNAKLTINANTVWAYAPVVVGLYDGPIENVGTEQGLIVEWRVLPPDEEGRIEFVESAALGGRKAEWALVDFIDFSGVTILQVLGHD